MSINVGLDASLFSCGVSCFFPFHYFFLNVKDIEKEKEQDTPQENDESSKPTHMPMLTSLSMVTTSQNIESSS